MKENNSDESQQIKFVESDQDAVNGQVKCPKCGSTDISQNPKTGKLRCNFCRAEFEQKATNKDTEEDVFALRGDTVYSGTKDIDQSAEDMVTIKCTACGAEVVIDTSETTQARCHWCRNTLSINKQIENGAVPDMVLPFKMKKEEAKKILEDYVKAHKFFALPAFTREFSANNIMGVYFPYMIVDANTHVSFNGEAEKTKRRYTVGSGDNKETRYDADVFQITREFDMGVDDLTLESSSLRMDGSDDKTNNIINAILPFDTENCVAYDSNYLKGCTSEKRDVDINDMRKYVNAQVGDIARFKVRDMTKKYDRGVKWEDENMDVIGTKWKSAYLPVWLYSYYQKSNDMLHYVAVNARTRETVGSIPINKVRLMTTSVFIEIVSFVLAFFMEVLINPADPDDDIHIFWLLLLAGFAFYFYQYSRYRRQGERHFHEKETRAYVKNEEDEDEFVKTRKGLSNSEISGRNDQKVGGVIIQPGKKGTSEKATKKAVGEKNTEKISRGRDNQ